MGTTPFSTSARNTRMLTTGPSHHAFMLLRIVFTIAPIVFGLDKFTNLLVDWPRYLAPALNDLIRGRASRRCM